MCLFHVHSVHTVHATPTRYIVLLVRIHNRLHKVVDITDVQSHKVVDITEVQSHKVVDITDVQSHKVVDITDVKSRVLFKYNVFWALVVDCKYNLPHISKVTITYLSVDLYIITNFRCVYSNSCGSYNTIESSEY